uniref:Cuticular protein 39 n=1 Tax=Microplitis mediator TaxID=375433 RepID=A0A650DLI1_9HYME|nr:cuticular protein 39 [Microplitis mediator]
MSLIILSVLFLSISFCCGENYQFASEYKIETTTLPPPPVPYSFNYKAGRYPGHVDRYRSESGDGAGVVHGTHSYIDPKFKIRTIHYTADKNGFHPILKNFEDVQAQPQDSEAVRLEKEKHHRLYEKIANSNANPDNLISNLPRDTASVARAKNHHFELFKKIAAEHEAIAQQREAERLAFEATSVPNNVEESINYYK